VDPAGALTHLTEISSQIEAVVVLEPDGRLLASTLADEARAERLAGAARALVAASQQVGHAAVPLVQLEVASAAGCVFVVRDGEHVIAATTSSEPTVGLVFYDLKSCLREITAENEDEARPRPKAKRSAAAEPADA
jgi:predicted regulator of Ras-like GTPase activity (Roadblock/LC7/MglB family)